MPQWRLTIDLFILAALIRSDTLHSPTVVIAGDRSLGLLTAIHTHSFSEHGFSQCMEGRSKVRVRVGARMLSARIVPAPYHQPFVAMVQGNRFTEGSLGTPR